jgi:hypothetical protein
VLARRSNAGGFATSVVGTEADIVEVAGLVERAEVSLF